MRWRPPVPGQKVGPFPGTRPADAAAAEAKVTPEASDRHLAVPPSTVRAKRAEPEDGSIERAADGSSTDRPNPAPDARPETSER